MVLGGEILKRFGMNFLAIFGIGLARNNHRQHTFNTHQRWRLRLCCRCRKHRPKHRGTIEFWQLKLGFSRDRMASRPPPFLQSANRIGCIHQFIAISMVEASGAAPFAIVRSGLG